MKNLFNPKKLTRIARGPVGSAGVFFGRAGLELAVARTMGGQITVVSQSNAPVEPSADATESKARAQVAAATLRQRVDPNEHRVVTAIGCEDVVCRTITLPGTDHAELEQMLALQIDNLTPLPLDEVVYSFEPLDIVNGQTVLLVAIARKDAVNARVEALETAGLPPQIVTVDALAIFRALMKRHLLPQGDALNTLIVFGNTGVNLVVHSRGIPVAVRSVMFTEELLKTAGGRGALRVEWQRTLVAVQAEQTKSPVGNVTFVTWGESMRSTAQELASEWDAPAESITNGAAPTPAFSLCLEGETGRDHLNLLPDEWRDRRRAAQLRQRLVRGGIVVAAVYALMLAIFVGFLAARRAQTNRTSGEIQRYSGRYSGARQLHDSLVAMQKHLDTKYSVLEVLREVVSVMPVNVKLNYYVFKKDNTVTIRGQGPSGTDTDFVSGLEKSALFSKVTTGQSRKDPGTNLTRFEIVCTLKSATGGPVTGSWH